MSDLRRLVEDALPRIANPEVHRPAVVELIVNVLAQWPGLRADMPPYADVIGKVMKINAAASRATQKTIAALETLGAKEELKRVLTIRARLGVDPSSPLPVPTGFSALLDTYVIAQRAFNEFARWKRLNDGMRRADPRSLAKRITGQLKTVIVVQAGVKLFQFEQVLKRLSRQHGLPALTLETIKKAKHRARKPRAPKQKGTFFAKKRKKCPSAHHRPASDDCYPMAMEGNDDKSSQLS